MFKGSLLRIGLILFGLNFAIFLAVYLFGLNANYYNSTLAANAFALPLLYTVFGIFSILEFRKTQALGLAQAVKRAFVPMWIGGILSLLAIGMFFNYVDPSAKNLFVQQGIAVQEKSLDQEYQSAKALEKTKKVPDAEESKKTDEDYKLRKAGVALQKSGKENTIFGSLFSLTGLLVISAVLSLFYLLLSLLLGVFLRNKVEPKAPKPNI
jgi:Protein of unknown function (DUF4199)